MKTRKRATLKVSSPRSTKEARELAAWLRGCASMVLKQWPKLASQFTANLYGVAK